MSNVLRVCDRLEIEHLVVIPHFIAQIERTILRLAVVPPSSTMSIVVE